MTLLESTVSHQIPLKSGETHQITREDIETYRAVFPRLDINQQLNQMTLWTISNPSKQKTQRGIKRFINSWLSRAFNDPRNKTTSTRSQTVSQGLNDRSWAM